ncbi:conserved hypothetical protein [Candidatus Terasakiella magnetica]|nr:conserved hypothetical protein [Candidatus Terasakiella magnetica]
MKNTSDKAITTAPPASIMTASDLANWGLPVIAYVKHVGPVGGGGWSIHAADGTAIGAAPDRQSAFLAIRQHDLEPVSVH